MNAIESKHRLIRDIFLRLCAENNNVNQKVLAFQSVRISNDLYGNDIASAHELAKGYTRPIDCCLPFHLPDSVRDGHEDIIAVRKINKILKSKSIIDKSLKLGDSVQIFHKMRGEKRGKWSSPRPVLNIDESSKTVLVPGSHGKTIKAAFEDIRHSIPPKLDFAICVQDAIVDCTNLINFDICDNNCLDSELVSNVSIQETNMIPEDFNEQTLSEDQVAGTVL